MYFLLYRIQTFYFVLPIVIVKCHFQKEKKVEIDIPKCILEYNSDIGTVGKLDK